MRRKKIEEDVRRQGVFSAYSRLPFNEAKKMLESKGYEIKEGPSFIGSFDGNLTKEAFVYDSGTKLWHLTKRRSPIMENPTEATKAHIRGSEFYLIDKQKEQALGDRVNDSILLNSGWNRIPVERLGEHELTLYLFGKIAQDYGLFIKDIMARYGCAHINFSVPTLKIGDKSLARPLYFGGAHNWSVIRGGEGIYNLCEQNRYYKETEEGKNDRFKTSDDFDHILSRGIPVRGIKIINPQ
ncbi:hypothetical protein J4425_01790 [Candidatus Woesearchaeota archaeon]|nr:hypothetical protein [Candidatus Woesearchaeota archaeon]